MRRRRRSKGRKRGRPQEPRRPKAEEQGGGEGRGLRSRGRRMRSRTHEPVSQVEMYSNILTPWHPIANDRAVSIHGRSGATLGSLELRVGPWRSVFEN
eukprot:152935-Pyramimonas_sp.AAC.1